ncbi:Protein of unknown function [Lactobacillus helveticus CIRM-BIA 101]|nr:Protein of unknown function [Lactobacillus helveticus CIRM-BIA 101]
MCFMSGVHIGPPPYIGTW